MNNLSLNVIGNRIEIVKDTYSTQSCVNYDSCSFSFNSEWDSFEKTAVFGFGNNDCIRVSLENNSCKIPAPCMQKEGFIRIGVYGINSEETVIATNCVAHRVEEGIDNLEDWFEEDSSFVFDALSEIEASLEEYKLSLDKRFDKLAGTLEAGEGVSDNPSDWYLPEPFTDSANVPSYSKASSYDDYLDYILNGLVTDYPNYVSSVQIGTDASGLYPIYAYIFEPISYEKTVFIATDADGTKSSPTIALSYFLNELCSANQENRTLGYLRSRIKLVVVPVVNPYGLAENSRYNSNNVRIDRNFDFKWSECQGDNKGAAAADQNETVVLQNYLQTLSGDKLCAVINFRDNLNLYCGKMLFYPRFKDNCIKALTKMLYQYNFEEKNENDLLSNTIIAPTLNPTMVNYAAENLGVNACTVAWPSLSYGDAQSNEAITKFTELIGNTVVTVAKNSTLTLRGEKVPFSKYFSWRSSGESDVFAVPQSETFKKAPISTYQLALRAPCNVTVNGYAIIKAESACNLRLNPLLWQDRSPEQTYADRLDMSDFVIELPLTVGTHIIPFDTVLQGYYSDNNGLFTSGYPEKLNFSIGLCADTASAAVLTGFSVTLNAFPSDIGRSVEISRPMGTADDYTSSNAVPTQVLIYPIQAIGTDEIYYND